MVKKRAASTKQPTPTKPGASNAAKPKKKAGQPSKFGSRDSERRERQRRETADAKTRAKAHRAVAGGLWEAVPQARSSARVLGSQL